MKNKIILYVFLLVLFLAPCLALSAQDSGETPDIAAGMSALVFQLSIIIFAARLGGGLFNKFKLPVVLGEIIAGIIIGPYLFGSVQLPGFSRGIFPLHAGFPVSAELYGISTIASIALLFIVGLETDVDTLFKFSAAGLLVGIFGVVGSFILGDLAAVLFSEYMFGARLGFGHPIPLFLGAISTATSVGITARILSDRKKMDSPEGITIISAAVIDDVFGIIALAVIIGACKNGHVAWEQVCLVSLRAIAIWLGFTALGLVFSRYLSRQLKRIGDRTVISIMSFALAMFLAGIFEKSGLAMIIGAYVTGLSLSKTDLSLVIQDKLSVLQKFFVPVFFCVMGMLVNFKDVASSRALFFAAIYLVFAVLGKILGCGLPALFCNFNLRGAMRVGVGMVPRGEVALIIAGIGLSAGIIPHDVFSIAVIMTLVTTLITPPVFSAMLASIKPVLRKEKKPKIEHAEIVYAMPNPETAGLVLNKVIETFERENFFIHLTEIPDKLYRICKDDIFITLKFTAQALVFDCAAKHVSFIHTLFYEVLTELEYIIKRLETLPDKKKIGRRIFDKGNHSHNGKAMLRQVIDKSSVRAQLKGETKTEIIAELVDILVDSGQMQAAGRAVVLSDLLERESIMSTGMQDGIALPHAKTAGVDRLVSAFGVKKEGIDFNSLDKRSSSIFVITLVPKIFSQPYLQYIAEIAAFLMTEENRHRILSCGTDDELYKILTMKE